MIWGIVAGLVLFGVGILFMHDAVERGGRLITNVSFWSGTLFLLGGFFIWWSL